jgi:methylmalonyl-CoA mutase
MAALWAHPVPAHQRPGRSYRPADRFFGAHCPQHTAILAARDRHHQIVDPWAGSYYVETLTDELVKRAWGHIRESKTGRHGQGDGDRPAQNAHRRSGRRRQARIDSKQETIVGVNKYRLDREAPIEILEVDNTTVREQQIARLHALRAERDSAAVEAALSKLASVAETGEGNLLELSIEAARAQATLGEISSTLEKVWGRHKAVIRSIAGVYRSEYGEEDEISRVRQMTDEFATVEGRRPRILVAKMGQDGHDRGAKVIATAFADLGFDVDIGPLFQTPEEVARQAMENDVHVIGVSSLAAGHKTLLPQLVAELERLGRADIMVVIGGVIPAQDYEFLYSHGAAAIFGPGTVIPVAAQKILVELGKRLGH